MKKKDIIFVLEQEIKWCKENKDVRVENYAGFIGGLEQAILLIKKMKEDKK